MDPPRNLSTRDTLEDESDEPIRMHAALKAAVKRRPSESARNPESREDQGGAESSTGQRKKAKKDIGQMSAA